ncbi:MAG: rubredoxin [Thermoproteota archaeon]|nr:MAG: rubredoxin [Candidatus Korarchaeota archaeon]RLG51713.1 MAG: rubredoxin [Candidatus Korarchaeota archaeon]
MAKWRCTVCGFVYDEEKGYLEGDIPAGTSFEDLPKDWVCPYCGASKDAFEKIS